MMRDSKSKTQKEMQMNTDLDIAFNALCAFVNSVSFDLGTSTYGICYDGCGGIVITNRGVTILPEPRSNRA